MKIVKDDHRVTLRQWHAGLQDKRALRASLRHSKTVTEACLSEGFRSLLMQTHSLWRSDAQEWRFTALAITAALAAHVKSIDERQTFATQLGQMMGNKPVMSELRFSRLSAVKTADELLRQLLRAVRLLNGTVNLPSLAEDVFHWCRENDELQNHIRRQQRPTECIRVRWAMEYFQAGDAGSDNNNEQ